MATELAVAYVSLVPSARGISAGIERELSGPTKVAATAAGTAAGRSFGTKFSGSLNNIIVPRELERSMTRVGTSADNTDQSFRRVGTGARQAVRSARGLGNTLTGLQDTSQGVSQIMKGDLLGGLISLHSGFIDLAAGVAKTATTIGKAIIEIIASTGRMIATNAVAVASTVAGWVVMGVQSLLAAAKIALAWVISLGPIGLVIAAVAGAVALIIMYWDEISAAISAAVRWVLDFVTEHWKLIVSIIGGPLGAVVVLIITHWDTIKNAFLTAMDFVVSLWTAGWDAVWAALEFVWGLITTFFVELPLKVIGWFVDAATWLWDAGKNILSGLFGGIGSFWLLTVLPWFQGLPDAFKGFFTGALDWLLEAGKNIFRGIKNGIAEIWNDVVEWFKDIPNKILSALGIASPPAWAIRAGREIMSGLDIGIAGGVGGLLARLKEVVAKASGITGDYDARVAGFQAQAAGARIGGITGGVGRWAEIALQALAMAGQPASYLNDLLMQMSHESGGNPNAINLWDSNAAKGTPSMGLMQCCPLDSLILTRRGWLRHDEVRVGDETIGYNPATQRAEWTAVTKIVHYEDAPIVRIGNRHWSARVTPNHRWWSDTLVGEREQFERCPECGWEPRGIKKPSRGVQVHRRKIHGLTNPVRPRAKLRGEFVRTHDLKGRHRIRVAAPADTDGIVGLSTVDAAVIGWLHGDGHLSAVDGLAWDGTIYQSKPQMVVKLRALLVAVPHTESVRERGGNTMPAHAFHLRRAYVTELIKRAGLDEDGDPGAFILRLSPDQRAAWLGAMIDAEGHTRDGFIRIAQVDGPMQDAIRLAVFLEGYRPTYSANSAERNGYRPAGSIGMARPHVAPGMFHAPEDAGRETVWCVKTDLETWTMLQDGQVMLTGNTIASTFKAYAGPLVGRGIFDPLANIYAAIQYTVSRYGDLGAWRRRGFKGYGGGGILSEDGLFYGHRDEGVFTRDQMRVLASGGRGGGTGGGPGVVINNLIVQANTPAEGRAAGQAFVDVLRERRVMVDARIA